MAPEQGEPAQSASDHESVTTKILTRQAQAALTPLDQADAPPAAPRVARAQLTRDVRQREPIDDLGSLVALAGEEVQTVYFFTDLRGLKGETITHRWTHDGEVMAELNFKVGGDRWRVYSSKKLIPTMVGAWEVIVLRSDGTPIHSSEFELVPPQAEQTALR
jgi:hypothetical protein